MSEAAVVTSDPVITAPPVVVGDAKPTGAAKFADLAGESYGLAKKEFIEKNGADAWRSMMDGTAPEPAAKNGEVKPALATNGKAAAEAKPNGEEAEPGEVIVEEDGTARDTKTGRYVPKSAYLRVKGEAKETRTANESLTKSVVQLQERLAILTEALPKTADAEALAEEKPIDPTEDVFGFLAQMGKRLDTLASKLDTTSKATEAKLSNTELRDQFLRDAQRFSTTQPAFTQAYAHVMDTLHKELEAEGVSDKTERDRAIAENIRDRATRLLKAGKSPAEAIWNIAAARGFRAQPAVDPGAEKEAAAKAELARINQTKAAGATLTGAGGVGNTEGLTTAKIQEIAVRGGDQYGATRRDYIKRYGEDAWKKLLGA